MPVIIGVSAGVGFVILIIIILAVCCVRHRIRYVNRKMSFTAYENSVTRVCMRVENEINAFLT